MHIYALLEKAAQYTANRDNYIKSFTAAMGSVNDFEIVKKRLIWSPE